MARVFFYQCSSHGRFCFITQSMTRTAVRFYLFHCGMILKSELNARSVPYMYVNTVSNEHFILIIKYSI